MIFVGSALHAIDDAVVNGVHRLAPRTREIDAAVAVATLARTIAGALGAEHARIGHRHAPLGPVERMHPGVGGDLGDPVRSLVASVDRRRPARARAGGAALAIDVIATGSTRRGGSRWPLVNTSIGTPSPMKSVAPTRDGFRARGNSGAANSTPCAACAAHSAEQNARTVLPSMMTCGVRKCVEPPHCEQRRVDVEPAVTSPMVRQ